MEDSLHCIETAAAAGFYTAAVYDRFSENEWDSICSSAWKNIRNISALILEQQEASREPQEHGEYRPEKSLAERYSAVCR